MKSIKYILIVLLISACHHRPVLLTGLEGKTMPSFTCLFEDSVTKFNSSSIPGGKPSVLFYFNPYCPYCRAETTEIIEDMNKLKGINFYLITSFSLTEMKNYATEFKLKNYLNITVVNDPHYFFINYFKAPGAPYLAFYNTKRKLNSAHLGVISTNDIVLSLKD